MNSRSLFAVIIIASAALLSGGCASIVKGTTQSIPVASDPAGAVVKLDGNYVGETPTKIEVKRKTDHLVTIEKEGYQVASIAVTRNIGGAVFGNIIAGGLVGWGVDAMSGAQYNLTPVTISATLKPVEKDAPPVAAAPNDAALFVSELKQLDELRDAKKISDEEYLKMRAALVEKYSAS